MSSTDHPCSLDISLQQELIKAARESIHYGLEFHTRMETNLQSYPESLQEHQATFVTLHKHGQLRGCIGTLQAIRPLIEDIIYNAYASAFSDPRFPPLSQDEEDKIDIEISLLTTPEPIEVASEQELLNTLKPGIDGLILKEGMRRATFLPSVWESLTTPQSFLDNLKIKAGLPTNHWSAEMKFELYHTEMIEESKL